MNDFELKCAQMEQTCFAMSHLLEQIKEQVADLKDFVALSKPHYNGVRHDI